jgi:hypothetical protein
MALGKNQSAGASQTGYVTAYGHLSGYQPQRTVATIPDAGHANGHDQRLAQGSRASICQRTVGSHSLPGYGPVTSVNRPVRTRMPGGVGAGGEKPPATRLVPRGSAREAGYYHSQLNGTGVTYWSANKELKSGSLVSLLAMRAVRHQHSFFRALQNYENWLHTA